MSNVAMAELSTERYLLDMPNEILFQIFRGLPKDKLIEISRLCSKFRDVAGDTRLWKNVYIKYEQEVVAFEELYSEPWPVKVVDLRHTKIDPPVSSKTDQVIKVFRLDLSSTSATKATKEAVLTKYQCKELYLDFTSVAFQYPIIGIEPKAFSKQTALEVLCLGGGRKITEFDDGREVIKAMMLLHHCRYFCHKQLAPVLSNCKNLKALHFSLTWFSNDDLMNIVGNLPASLEKLFLGCGAVPFDSFFELLAESSPNLKELQLCGELVKFPSLLKFQFLEVLHIFFYIYDRDSIDLLTPLTRFPALKTVYLGIHFFAEYSETYLRDVRTKLEPHGIVVQPGKCSEGPPQDGNLWKVSEATT